MDAYEEVRHLGRGAFGEVSLVRHRFDGTLCALKTIPHLGETLAPTGSERETAREVRVLQKMHHPCILRFYASIDDGSAVHLITEYADSGDLQQLLRKFVDHGRRLEGFAALAIFAQLAGAVKHVHSKRVLHRDLKPSNILLTSEGLVKLGDFGVAKVIAGTAIYDQTSCVGSPVYMAPEVVGGQNYGAACDVWSLGVILYEICALKKPFEGRSLGEVAMRIMTGQFTPLSSNLEALADLAQPLVDRMLVLEVVDRATIAEVTRNPLISTLADSPMSCAACVSAILRYNDARGNGGVGVSTVSTGPAVSAVRDTCSSMVGATEASASLTPTIGFPTADFLCCTSTLRSDLDTQDAEAGVTFQGVSTIGNFGVATLDIPALNSARSLGGRSSVRSTGGRLSWRSGGGRSGSLADGDDAYGGTLGGTVKIETEGVGLKDLLKNALGEEGLVKGSVQETRPAPQDDPNLLQRLDRDSLKAMQDFAKMAFSSCSTAQPRTLEDGYEPTTSDQQLCSARSASSRRSSMEGRRPRQRNLEPQPSGSSLRSTASTPPDPGGGSTELKLRSGGLAVAAAELIASLADANLQHSRPSRAQGVSSSGGRGGSPPPEVHDERLRQRQRARSRAVTVASTRSTDITSAAAAAAAVCVLGTPSAPAVTPSPGGGSASSTRLINARSSASLHHSPTVPAFTQGLGGTAGPRLRDFKLDCNGGGCGGGAGSGVVLASVFGGNGGGGNSGNTAEQSGKGSVAGPLGGAQSLPELGSGRKSPHLTRSAEPRMVVGRAPNGAASVEVRSWRNPGGGG
eukprot:TRINITY_DN48555_c0_g1_i1.p1 TRINITY_DN48555_c0_g1~~TRINITY_DN48555_c0_g1_i1.p1  ORF type:complete len:799 (-),score=89.78 TRINITY_DN48555_c0_g1_i1:27-2423(-)